MEKAKYIENKEVTLFSDLDKSQKKLKEIANWHKLSDYTPNYIDNKNIKLYVEKVNNIYHELRTLLFETKNYNLYEELPNLITKERLDLEEIEKVLLQIAKDKIQKGE